MKRLIVLFLVLLVGVAGTSPDDSCIPSERHLASKILKGIVTDDYNAPIPGANVLIKGTSAGTITDLAGEFELRVQSIDVVLVVSSTGFQTNEKPVKAAETFVSFVLKSEVTQLEEEVVSGYSRQVRGQSKRSKAEAFSDLSFHQGSSPSYQPAEPAQNWNTEEYATIHENIFLRPANNPLSTFSIDVDAASYSNIRRFIDYGQRPPVDAVRIEEMINYFDYEYGQPQGTHPFAIHTELTDAPWKENHELLRIGLQGVDIPRDQLPPSNLVFLIDVSGSMSDYNKLPLLKSSFKLLVEELRSVDKVAIVVYAGAAGLVLPPTSGDQKSRIIGALERLQAGGSTAGGAGIQLAYGVARDAFIQGGNNRVILATDGDFNIGESSNSAMERLISDKKEDGIFLTVLGFGMGNYKDSKMEILADHGNGNYAYIDTMNEAERVLKKEFGGTLFTIAKDVKIQIEFNPARVQAYRLIGYENRKLQAEDFNNDRKDAGDLGSGHSVTALYEIVRVGVSDPGLHGVDELRYQSSEQNRYAGKTGELAQIKFRYKEPNGSTSKLITSIIEDKKIEWGQASIDTRWAASVATLGMILRDSEFKGTATCDDVVDWAGMSTGSDPDGYRREFIKMAKTCSVLARK